ncbi:hypothetical protein RESH_04862 [Rhodopirellula europaea SH398]|uniref:Uncharacterized protein n=1 Tax=Rhodopirellula europaea SH398 TaxID=1263868 RepID=M5RZ58_9BACT|nr:hypothetical protein RESH_04862 [Rhodopirellula europaea SH398]
MGSKREQVRSRQVLELRSKQEPRRSSRCHNREGHKRWRTKQTRYKRQPRKRQVYERNSLEIPFG